VVSCDGQYCICFKPHSFSVSIIQVLLFDHSVLFTQTTYKVTPVQRLVLNDQYTITQTLRIFLNNRETYVYHVIMGTKHLIYDQFTINDDSLYHRISPFTVVA